MTETVDVPVSWGIVPPKQADESRVKPKSPEDTTSAPWERLILFAVPFLIFTDPFDLSPTCLLPVVFAFFSPEALRKVRYLQFHLLNHLCRLLK